MKKYLMPDANQVCISLSIVFILCLATGLQAQLSGPKSIPGDYATIAAAVTDLNTVGVGAGGVTFNVAAGHTESSATQILLTATGTMADPIVFQKSGGGANPLVSRTDAGSTTTSTLGGLGDAIIRINGSDYVTFDGIDVSASDQGIEYGYFTYKNSGTDGCQVVTIRNAAVTMTKGTSAYVMGIYISNGPPTASSATGVTVSANSGRNENITIIGNTISNVHTGIYLRGGSASGFGDINPVIGQAGMGNIIQNFGGGASSTTYGVYFIYQVNPSVEDNTIDNAGGGGSAHASTLYGMFFSSGVLGDLVVENNSITLNTSGTSAVQWIYSGNTVTSSSISNNTLAGSIAATTTSYLIYNSNSTVGTNVVANNQTSGTVAKTGASGTLYGYYNNGSPGSGTEIISGNDFSNITLTGTSIFTGIHSTTATGHTQEIFNNSISNISGTHSGTTIGINVTLANTRSIYNNSIHSISSSGTIQGIANGSGGATSLEIYNNKIYGLTSNSTGTTAGLVTGILVSSGTTNSVAQIFNNLIGSLEAPTAAGTDAIRGISITSTVATTSIELSYNSIYVNASSSGTNFGSSGLYHTTSTTATTAALLLRNNIIVNTSVANGTGLTAAYRRSSTTLTNYSTTSNNNLFYAGTPGPGSLIFADGTNASQTLGDFASLVTPRESVSISENPAFLSTSGGNVNFLHLDTSVPTAIESGGTPVAGITDDYDGDTRNVSTPDIGADEFAGMTLSCTGTPVASNAQVSPTPPHCVGQSITLSLDQTYTAVQFQWQSSVDNSVWMDIMGATFETYGAVVASTIYYRCVVTCPASMLSTASASVQITVPSAMAGSYTIDNTLPTGGTNYNNFIDAIFDLNCRGVGGAITFDVTAGQVYPSSDSLNILVSGTPVNTITFVKSGMGANPKIQRSGTGATTNYILRIGGGDYFTFDGIDFEQTGTMASDFVEYGVYLQNASSTDGAQHNTIKNGVISLSNTHTSAKGIYVHASPTPTAVAGTNSYNQFLNMTLQNAWEGYRITGATSTYMDTANVIDIEGGGISLVNLMGDGTGAASVYGIFASYQKDLQIRNTEISNLNPGGTSLVYGITLQSSTSNSADLFDNTIHDISGGGTLYGIYVSSGDTITIQRNRIYNLSTSGTSGSLRGIYLTSSTLNGVMASNRIYNLSSSGITGTTVAGIDVGAGAGYEIYNNMISGLSAPASTTSTGGTRGIAVSSGSAGNLVRIYYNTVLLNDVAAVAGYTSAGISNTSVTPILDLRNNIVVNNSDISTIGTRVAAFWKTSATDNVSADCNNNLYYAGMPSDSNLIYYDGTNAAQTIPAYIALAAITPAEGLSVTENVDFDAVVNGVIRPDPLTATLVESGGAEIPMLTEDFEADNRGVYPLMGQANGGGFNPDIGADEGDFTYVAPAVPDCPTLNDPLNGETDVCPFQTVALSWTPAITGGLPTLGYDIYFGTTMSPPFVANTNLTTYVPMGLTTNTTYYWQVIPKNTSGPAVGCAVFSFTTMDIAVASTTPGSRCGTGTVTLGATGTGTLNWYDTPAGGAVLGTGTSFVTPVITTTTDFYVAASNGANISYGARPNPAGTSTTTASTYGLVFDATASFVLESVEVYASASGNVVVHLTNSAGTVLQSTTVPVNGLGTGTPEALLLNFNITPGTGYRLLAISSPAMVRESSLGGFPYSLGANGSVTNGYISGNSTTYYYFYNWKMVNGCETARTAVTATVTPADLISIMPSSITRCDAEPASQITASSSYPYTYTWSPASGLDMTNGPLVMADPASTTTYTVTGDDGICYNTATIEVTVNPTPAAPMVDPITLCQGDTGTLMVMNPINDPPFSGAKIGAGTSTTSIPGPYRRFYGGHRYQMLYTAAEITASGITAGELVSLSFFVNSVPGGVTSLDNVEIKLKNTSSTALTTTFETGGTSVYTAVSYQPVVGLNTHTFNGSTFIWDGTSNLLVDFCFNNAGGGGASTSTEYTTVSGSCTSFPLDNSATVCTNATGTTSDLRPNIQLEKSGLGVATYTWNPGSLMGTTVEISPSSTTVYTVSGSFPNGCADSSMVTVTVNSSPTITLGSNPSVCTGITMADLTYSGTANSPDEYSIDFDPAAEAQGFVDVVNAMLPASPIVITVPGAAPEGLYNAMLSVRVNSSTCESVDYPIMVTVLGLPDAGTVSGTTSLCVAAMATFMSNGDAGGTWSSTNPAVASVDPMTGIVTALTPGMTDITYTVTNICGGPVSDFETLTVDPVQVLNTNDAGPGSLREIIACAGPGATITFDAALMNQTIILTGGEIIIDKNITLDGIGMLNLTLSGNSMSRIFHVMSGDTLRIEDMALMNATAMTNGGALFVEGSLILENVLLDNNDENGTPKSLTIVNPAELVIIGTVEFKE